MNKKLQMQLIARAWAAAGRAYAPYSKFQVGAALLVAGNRVAGSSPPRQRDRRLIIAGCNVENASYGITICAERAALAAAVAAGFRRFEALAVVAAGTKRSSSAGKPPSSHGKAVVPCGACLQALAEFCEPDFMVLTAAMPQDGKITVYALRDLLPHVFHLRP